MDTSPVKPRRVRVFRTSEPDPVELNRFLEGGVIDLLAVHTCGTHYAAVEYVRL